MDFMTGQGHSHGWAWESIGPPTCEPGPANQNEVFPTKGLYYIQKYSSVSSAVQVTGLRWSHRWRSWMWRSWAGMVTHGLWLWGRLDILTNSLIKNRRPVKIAHFIETTNVGTYKCVISAESLNSCLYNCTVLFTVYITVKKCHAIVWGVLLTTKQFFHPDRFDKFTSEGEMCTHILKSCSDLSSKGSHR